MLFRIIKDHNMIRKELKLLLFLIIKQIIRILQSEFYIMLCHVVGIGIIDCRATVFIRPLDKET